MNGLHPCDVETVYTRTAVLDLLGFRWCPRHRHGIFLRYSEWRVEQAPSPLFILYS